MSFGDLRDLYQELILDHRKNPRNFGPVVDATHAADGDNPLCGDKLVLQLIVEDGRIVDIGFQGSGCAISTASASTMTESVKGKTVEEAATLFERFHDLVTDANAEADFDALGKLAAFGGVAEFPMRVKCATLAWHTLQHALEGDGSVATTE